MTKTKERLTIQKQVILDYLTNTKSHPDGDTIYLEAKKKIPTISKGTVYRILKQLQEKGQIQAINIDKTHFDGNTSIHAHFICENKQKIYDIFLDEEDLKQIKQKIKVGKINKIQILIYGECK